MKQLIKISDEHYIITNDEDINEGDFVYEGNEIIQFKSRVAVILANNQFAEYGKKTFFKVTHSTKPLSNVHGAKLIDLSEIKRLSLNDDLDKKASLLYGNTGIGLAYKNIWLNGYNEAIEENKDKLYTNKNVLDFLHFLTFDHNHKYDTTEDAWDDFKQRLQKKTSWEVDIIDDKIVLL